jgi:hypothetical protein
MRHARAVALIGPLVGMVLVGMVLAASAHAAVLVGTARLQGQFLLSGRITVAVDVRGEHVGQKVTRRWTFSPSCQAGQCPEVQLIRQRSGGSDRLVLRRAHPGYYTGTGSFYAALRCGSRTLRKGELVPFTITVRITKAFRFGSAVLARQISATYTNRRRINLTRCVTPLIHDAARYQGHLLSM